jgi:NAD(P) transhydrogenase subunit alpha
MAGETRVALTPEVAAKLVKAGHVVAVEREAGAAAGQLDAAYVAAGARVGEAAEVLAEAHVLARVQPPSRAEAEQVPEGALVIGFLHAAQNADAVRALAARKASAFALELLPRTTKAQTMDALSSMSTVAGYRAALLAAQHLGRFFPMLMTAAGTVPPARVLVLGVGVAGLQAIATARRLGAVVEAYDLRPEAREQAKSLGATTIEVDAGEEGRGEGGYAKALSAEAQQRLAEKLAQRIKASDAVITTALVPGKPAPRLIAAETVRGMRPGAVVVDLAAEAGGNCEGTEAGRVTVKGHVTLVGLTNLPATMATDASRLYAKNVEAVLQHLAPKAGAEAGGPNLDLADEITAGALALHGGAARHPSVEAALAAGGGA